MKFLNTEKTDFYFVLKTQVDAYFSNTHQSSYSNRAMYFKIVFWLFLWLGTYLGMLLLPLSNLQFFLLGVLHLFTHVMIAFNIAHDANHGALFQKPALNSLFSHSLELVGANATLWKCNHNINHHTYVNIAGKDNSIEGYKLFRFTETEPVSRHHRYQHIYAFFFYAVSTLNYVVAKDFKIYQMLSSKEKARLNTVSFWTSFLFFKAFYFFYILVLPLLVTDHPFLYIAGAFIVGHFINGMLLAVIFQVGHLTEGTHFPEESSDGNISRSWAEHIMATTDDFGIRKSWVQWLFGGINIHIVHHLFPKVCHVHYPKLIPIIKQAASQYGMEYREIPGIWQAIRSHYALLKKLGNG